MRRVGELSTGRASLPTVVCDLGHDVRAMRSSANQLSIGERVAFYRRRRGMTHATLAGLVGRTTSWLEKIENGRAPLDRVSVIRDLARVLDVSLHDLLPDDVRDANLTPREPSVPALRELVLSYRAVNPRFAASAIDLPSIDVDALRGTVRDIWSAYQDSRFGYVIMRLNRAIPLAYVASRESTNSREAYALLAQLYHVAASVLVKLGDLDLAQLCADRGDIAAQEAAMRSPARHCRDRSPTPCSAAVNSANQSPLCAKA